MERSKKRGKSKCFILRWKFSVVRFQLSEVSLTQRRRGLAEEFLVFRCQFSVDSHMRRAGFCWFLLVWGLISLTRRRRGIFSFSFQLSATRGTLVFGWFLLVWGLISLMRRRRGLAEEYWNLGV